MYKKKKRRVWRGLTMRLHPKPWTTTTKIPSDSMVMMKLLLFDLIIRLSSSSESKSICSQTLPLSHTLSDKLKWGLSQLPLGFVAPEWSRLLYCCNPPPPPPPPHYLSFLLRVDTGFKPAHK